jgi:hypothetical protein
MITLPEWIRVRPTQGQLIDELHYASHDGYELVVAHLMPVSCWTWSVGRQQTDLARGNTATADEGRQGAINALMRLETKLNDNCRDSSEPASGHSA